MSECLTYSLSGIVDRYLARKMLSKKKYFLTHLIVAEEVWQSLFLKTLWSVKSVWKPLKQGNGYVYIDIPTDSERLLSAGVEDKCGNMKTLYYNNKMNVVAKPSKKCSCGCNECGGLCDDVGGMTISTRVVFTMNGIDYIEKSWVKVCKNGDVLEYRETPTKSFNDRRGDGGDFNNDFNNDFDIASETFGDFDIVTVESQRKICKLDVLPCGCVVDSEENKDLLLSTCGYYLPFGCCSKEKYCDSISGNINNNFYGEVKISACGTRIEYRPSAHWKKVTDKKYPEYLNITYQTDGIKVGAETLVPKYAAACMYTGIDYELKRFNGKYSAEDKRQAMYAHNNEIDELTGFLHPIYWENIGKIQDAKIKY